MAPLGSASLLAIPVMRAGAVHGTVLLEDARRDPAARDLARACATLVALRTPPGPRIAAAERIHPTAAPADRPGDA